MEGQCNCHLLKLYVHHQYFLYNHHYQLENHQIHVSEKHVSFHYYHQRCLAYFYGGGVTDKTRESGDSPSDTDGCSRNIDDEYKNEEDEYYIDPASKKMI